MKQPVVIGGLGRVKPQPHSLAWAVDVKEGVVSYAPLSKDPQPFPFDPRTHIIGVYLGAGRNKAISRR